MPSRGPLRVSGRKSMIVLSNWGVSNSVCLIGVFLFVKIHLRRFYSEVFCFVREVKWNLAGVWKLLCSNCARITRGAQSSLLASRTDVWVPLGMGLIVEPTIFTWSGLVSWAMCSKIPLLDDVWLNVAGMPLDLAGYFVPSCHGAPGSEKLFSNTLFCDFATTLPLPFWHKKCF